MLKNLFKKFLHRVSIILLMNIIILIGGSKTIFAQKLKIGIQTIQNGGSIKYKLLKKNAKNLTLYNIQLSNKTGKNQNLNVINVSFQPNDLISDGTHYMVGANAQRYNEYMKQLITGTETSNPNNYGNMYLLFKRGESDYLLVGVTSWRSFLCKISTKNGVVHIQGEGDNKLIRPGEKIDFEQVIVLKNTSWQDILYQYSEMIAKENHIFPPPDVRWKGWTTWDYYKQHFTEKDIDKNVKALQKLNVQPNIIQIDGGWWKERGDYLEARDNLPGGIKAIVDNIHKDGYKAGLHFDGFRASKTAKIVKEHPDYFIHTSDGHLLDKGKDSTPGNSLVFWDYSNPGAREYIKKVMKNAREKWGVDYFKIDFMKQGLYEGVSYLPVTNVERFRMGINAMKEGMGKGAYFLACGSNFGTVLGLVDAIRVAVDIHPNYHAVMSRAQHTSGSFYFQPKLCQVDPDYLVLRSENKNDLKQREGPSLTFDQGAMWSNYISIFGNVRLESDNIEILTPEKKELIKSTFNMPFFQKVIPMDLWDHYKAEIDAPYFYLAETPNGIICIGLFNWDETDAKFSISGFKGNPKLLEFGTTKSRAISNGGFSIPLKGVHSILYQYNGKETFDQLRKQLMVSVDKAPFNNQKEKR